MQGHQSPSHTLQKIPLGLFRFLLLTLVADNISSRQAILNHYQQEIETTYQAVEETTQSNIPAPSEWSSMTTKDFVHAVVAQVLSPHKVQDFDDIFQHGCDRYSI